ncbi:MAG: hypothetical protein FJ298_03475 [Planctomycetes bacterium]|nr:hypothetical protein [Planctomycetota bacterium]
MKTQLLGTLIHFAFVAPGCETVSETLDSIPLIQAQDDEAVEKAEDTQDPQSAASDEPLGTVQRIDGREKAPAAQSGTVAPMDRVGTYAFGSRPSDLETQADSFEIAPLSEPLSEPVKRPDVAVDR